MYTDIHTYRHTYIHAPYLPNYFIILVCHSMIVVTPVTRDELSITLYMRYFLVFTVPGCASVSACLYTCMYVICMS